MQYTFQFRRQGNHRQLGIGACNLLHNQATQGNPASGREHFWIRAARCVFNQGLQDSAHIADWHAFIEQILQYLHKVTHAYHFRHQPFDQLALMFANHVEQLLYLVMTQQQSRMIGQDLAQMGSHHGRGIHHRIPQRLCLRDHLLGNPDCFQSEGGIPGRYPLDLAEHLPRIDGHLLIMVDIGLAGTDPHQGDAVLVWRQIQVVANVDGRDQKAQLLREFLAHPFDPVEQFATLIAIYQRDQLITHFQPDDVHRHHIVPAQLFLLMRLLSCSRQQLALGCRQFLAAQQPPGAGGGESPQTQEGEMRHPRHQPHHQQNPGRDDQRLGIVKQLA